jgi:2-C-methyl-D-erythritol 4-phosphate cytidylyltransferase
MKASVQFAAVLPAGGLGKRMGLSVPKQLLELDGKPMWRICAETFLRHPQIGRVCLVVPHEWKGHFEADCEALGILLVEGGADRWMSVRNGCEALAKDSAPQFVLVHDVARPFVTMDILDKVLETLPRSACLVAKKATDTVKIAKPQNGNLQVERTIDRETVWLAQTPQATSLQTLLALYQKIDETGIGFVPTDEASILEHFGIPVEIVEGNTRNDKITTVEDLHKCGQNQI